MTSFINKGILVSIFVTVFVTEISGARRGSCPDPVTGEQTRYNPSSEICCGGSVFPAGENNRAICCGDTTYNPRREICCGGEVKKRSSDYKCCDFRKWYDSTTHICCGNDVHSNRNGHHKCCGSDAYNTRSDTCCRVNRDEYGWGEMKTLPGVGQCCGNTVIDPDRQLCCSGVAHEKTNPISSCCGNSSYDSRTELCCGNKSPYDPHSQICCDGNVYHGDNGAKCCGRVSYRAAEASCCHDNVFRGIPEVPNVQSCCGGVAYFKTNQMCCEGTLHDIQADSKCCGSDTYNASSELCCEFGDEIRVQGKTSPTDECCGLSTYDAASQTCCEAVSRSFDVVGGECCGKAPWDDVVAYDPKLSTCCRGRDTERLYHGQPNDQSMCCGRSLMNENELCYPHSEMPVVKYNSTDNALCSIPQFFNVAIPYNTQTQICLEDGAVVEYSRTVDVCGYELYDPTAEICCEGFIRGRFDEDGYERSCCGGTTLSFTPDLQTCCVGNVHNIPTSQARCCRTKAYDTSTHVCSDTGIVRSLAEATLFPEICGDIPYHPDEFSCCSGFLIGLGELCCQGQPNTIMFPRVADAQCCGFYAFDPSSQICCQGGSVLPKTSNESSCCGFHVLSDTQNEICCDGMVNSKVNGRTVCEGDVAFNPDTETVCNNQRYPIANAECCGGRAYDDNVHLCCKEQMHLRTSNTQACCGTETYDMQSSTLMCCNGQLNEGGSSLECCGDVAIDPVTQSCCQNNVFPFVLTDSSVISCCNPDSYGSHSQHTCCGGVEHKFVANGECCGLDVIRNPEEEICCDGRVVEKAYGEHTECCGGRLIDTRRYTCCNNRVLYPGSVEECCGDAVIDSNIQTCCGGQAVQKTEDHGCCAGQTYSRNQQGCCGSRLFDLTTELCSNNDVITSVQTSSTLEPTVRATEGRAVATCGDRPYDLLSQMCCGNNVVDKDNYICCNGIPFDSSSGKTGCCSGTAYNPNTFDCCSGILHDRFKGAQCCGSSYYNPSKEVCCEDDVIVSSQRGEKCPGEQNFKFGQAPQCLCSLISRGSNISSECGDSLRTKQHIFTALITDFDGHRSDCRGQTGGRCSMRFNIAPINALRGSVPVVRSDESFFDDQIEIIPVVTSSEINCPYPSLKLGHKIIIFIESVAGLEQDDTELQLTVNDVIIPYTRKLERTLQRL